MKTLAHAITLILVAGVRLLKTQVAPALHNLAAPLVRRGAVRGL